MPCLIVLGFIYPTPPHLPNLRKVKLLLYGRDGIEKSRLQRTTYTIQVLRSSDAHERANRSDCRIG